MDAMLIMIRETRIDVGSYGALKKGRNGIGNRTHTHKPATIDSIFHLFLILCLKNDIAADISLFPTRSQSQLIIGLP
jgi:hypothetical protein